MAKHSSQPQKGSRQRRPPQRSQRPQSNQQHPRQRPQSRQPQSARPQQRPQQGRKSPVVPIIAAVLALALIGVGGFFLVRALMTFEVSVNGNTVKLHNGDTVAKLLDEGYVSVTPGDLLAVDGSMLTEGGGDRCTVTVNGASATETTVLSANAVVEVTDGGDTTEEAEVTEETIPHGTREGDTSFGAYWYGSIHLLSDGEDGTKRVSTGKVSGKTVEEVVKQPIDAGYRIYTARPMDRVVALTFDDGPWPETTDQILDVLEQNNAKATFFTIGSQISQYASSVKRANEMGCQICTHTWDHAEGSGQGTNIGYMSASEQVQEVERGYKAIADVLGEEPAHILRAPGGNFNGDTITNLWDYVDAEIGWDLDTEDWRRPGSDSIANMILSVQPGQVILMHDGGGDRSQTVEALREALPQLVEKGYSFVTIDELLAYGMPSDTSSPSAIETTTSSSESSTSATA